MNRQPESTKKDKIKLSDSGAVKFWIRSVFVIFGVWLLVGVFTGEPAGFFFIPAVIPAGWVAFLWYKIQYPVYLTDQGFETSAGFVPWADIRKIRFIGLGAVVTHEKDSAAQRFWFVMSASDAGVHWSRVLIRWRGHEGRDKVRVTRRPFPYPGRTYRRVSNT